MNQSVNRPVAGPQGRAYRQKYTARRRFFVLCCIGQGRAQPALRLMPKALIAQRREAIKGH
jgi:hypothetical protein